MALCSVYYCGAWGRGFENIPDHALDCIDIFNYSNAAVTLDAVTLNNPEETKGVKALKERKPEMKIVLSLVGFSDCTDNEDDARDAAKRAAHLALEYGFDGVDLDWEFPTRENRHMHTVLVKNLREEMGKERIVSIASPGTNWAFEITELEESHKYLDYINIMTYDVYSERCITSHHSAPRSSKNTPFPCAGLEDNLVLFKKKGIPARKLIGGAAYYSRIWTEVESAGDGLFAVTEKCADYGPNFYAITEDYIKDGGFEKHRDDSAGGAPWLWNGSTFITYDDEISIAEKCRIVKKHGTGGMMAWEYALDTEDHRLLHLMRDGLK